MINSYRLSLRIDASPSLVIVNCPRRSGKTNYISHRMRQQLLHDPVIEFEYKALTEYQTTEFKENNRDLFVNQNRGVKRILFIEEPFYFNPRILVTMIIDDRYTQIIMFSTGMPQQDIALLNGLIEYGFVVIDAPIQLPVHLLPIE